MRREVLLNRLNGRGRVFRGSEVIAKAQYEIAIYQTFIDDVPSLKRVSLDLSPTPPFTADMLVLSLHDGRKLKFLTKTPDTILVSGMIYD